MKPVSLKSRFLECTVCKLTFAVIPDGAEDLLIGRMACSTSGCKGRFKTVKIAQCSPRQITAVDLYTALGGGGLPEERKRATPAGLKSELEGEKINKIQVSQAPGTRSFITAITLENGKVIHFAGSTEGATIYKVTGGQDGGR